MGWTLLVWGFLVRIGQAALEASLTVVVGLIVAGVLRRMVGPAGTRRLFGRGVSGLFRGWLAGMLLPVCSLGVIPVAWEMRRAGVPGGTVLSFVLAAPLLNPISFLYGLTLAEPFVICCFAAASLLLSTLAGSLWERVFARDSAAEAQAAAAMADEPLPAAGPRRLLAVVVTGARHMTGGHAAFIIIGLVGSAVLAAIIPHGSLQGTMKHSDWTSPLLMTAVAVPIYSSPLLGMMKIGLMFEHGNSIGAAFVLFILGIGTNLGLMAWLAATYRPLRMLAWLAVWVILILMLAYAAEPLLYDSSRPELDHTHAFDDYSCPFPAGENIYLLPLVRQKLAEKFGPLEQTSISILASLIVLGLLIRRIDRHGAIERWLTAPPQGPVGPTPWWNQPIPGPILGGITIAGLIILSIIGTYVYYPDPEQVLNDLSQERVNAIVAIRTGKSEEAIRYLERMDLYTRKLQVGVYIRTGRLSQEARAAAGNLQGVIEELRDLLLAGRLDEAKEMLKDFENLYHICREVYRQP